MTVALNEPAGTLWTDEDIARFERPGYKVEIIDGSLHVTPPANEWHQDVEFTTQHALCLSCPAGWRVRHERGVMAGVERFVPDVVVLVPQAPVEPEWLPAELDVPHHEALPDDHRPAGARPGRQLGRCRRRCTRSASCTSSARSGLDQSAPSNCATRSSRWVTVLTCTCRTSAARARLPPQPK